MAGLVAAAAQVAATKDSKAKAIEGLPCMNKTLFKRVASNNAMETTGGIPGGIGQDINVTFEAPATRTSAGDTTADGLMH